MNYTKIYYNIVSFRKNNECDGYSEVHHIIPRCLGGDDSSENLVKLSAREHFICHLLLTKIYKGTDNYQKVIHAFLMMLVFSNKQNRFLTSKKYEKLRIEFSKRMSLLQGNENNSQFGTVWISNCETKTCKKIKKTDDIPKGWIKGRYAWNKILLKEKQQIRKTQKTNFYCEKAQNLWNEFKTGNYASINEFCKITKCGSLRGLTRLWMKYIPEYKTVAGQGIRVKKYL